MKSLDRLCCIRDIGEATINRVLEPSLKSLTSLLSLYPSFRGSDSDRGNLMLSNWRLPRHFVPRNDVNASPNLMGYINYPTCLHYPNLLSEAVRCGAK